MSTRLTFARPARQIGIVLAVTSAVTACASVLGDFTTGETDGGGGDDATTTTDAAGLDAADGAASDGQEASMADRDSAETSGADATTMDGTSHDATMDGTSTDALSDQSLGDVAPAPDGACPSGSMTCGGVCASCSPPPDGGVSVCSGSSCTFACTGAGLTKCGNTCTDVQTDAKNCGTCGIDCLAGTCSASQCQPWSIATATDGAIFAPGGGIVSYLVTDGTNVIWLDQAQGVMEVPIGGGTPIPLAATGSTSGTFEGLALANGVVAWTTSTPALQVAVEGTARSQSPAQSLGTGTPQGLTLNSTASTAYFVLQGSTSSSINGCNLGSTVSCFTLTNWALSATTVTGNDVVFSTMGYLFATDSAGGAVSRWAFANSGLSSVATGQTAPFRLMLDSTFVYWGNSDTTNNAFSIVRASQANPSPTNTTIVASGVGTLRAMATDGTFNYYAPTSGSSVSYQAVDGTSAPSTLPTLPGGAGTILAISVAGGVVVWFDASNDGIYGIRAP